MSTTKSVNLNIYSLLVTANRISMNHIDTLVRDVMKNHPELKKFCIRYGDWFFIDESGEEVNEMELDYLTELSDFIAEWNDSLHTTNKTMTITPDKPTEIIGN